MQFKRVKKELKTYEDNIRIYKKIEKVKSFYENKILTPTLLIGVCGMKSMHCAAVTKPTLIVFGILILTLTLIQSILLWKKR